MSVLAVVGAKGAPGATTAVLALALGWPAPVLVVDADPGGGDIAAGWLAGRVDTGGGLLGFAAATRHLNEAPGGELARTLAGEVVAVPDAPGLLVLPGLMEPGQAGAVDPAAWARLASAVAVGPGPGVGWVDALVDCGRLGPATPGPVLVGADIVLLAVRPTVRGCHHAGVALSSLAGVLGGLGRVGLLVCGPGPYRPEEAARALGVAAHVVLPADPAGAAVLSDGASAGRVPTRGALLRAARSAARSLHSAMATGVSSTGRR